MERKEEPQRVALLRDLGAMDTVPVGARVLVEEDEVLYTGVGATTSEIARRIGWPDANIWIPDHVLARIEARPVPFVDAISVASIVMQRPTGVN